MLVSLRGCSRGTKINAVSRIPIPEPMLKTYWDPYRYISAGRPSSVTADTTDTTSEIVNGRTRSSRFAMKKFFVAETLSG